MVSLAVCGQYQVLTASTVLKYPLDQSKTVDASTVGDFVDRFVAGDVKASVKSQPIPKSQDGPVYVLVADDFDKVTSDPKKDLLVECASPRPRLPEGDIDRSAQSTHLVRPVASAMRRTLTPNRVRSLQEACADLGHARRPLRRIQGPDRHRQNGRHRGAFPPPQLDRR